MFNCHRYDEIMVQIQDLADEALDMLPEVVAERARGYWYAQIMQAIGNQHEFLGECGQSMHDSLESAEELVDIDIDDIDTGDIDVHLD